MPAQTRFCPLGIFEFDNFDPLDRLLAHTEQSGSDLGDHMVVVGLQFIGITALTRTAEGAECGCRFHAAQHGCDADRSIGHAAPVERDLDPDPVGIVPPSIQLHTHIHIIFGNIALRGRILSEHKPEFVKTSTGTSGFILESCRRDLSEFRHVPGTCKEIRCPPKISQGIKIRIFLQGESLFGTGLVTGLGTIRPNA